MTRSPEQVNPALTNRFASEAMMKLKVGQTVRFEIENIHTSTDKIVDGDNGGRLHAERHDRIAQAAGRLAQANILSDIR
ncbi:MAG TPA: hypothetical protein VMT22_05035 [Terriglobales bacterium]|nr:hypothetical protein [Terriglobales bacterium]